MGVSIHTATEDDLDALVGLQFRAFGEFDELVAGRNTPENRAIMVKRHIQHMHANPGLVIAKAQLPDGTIAGFCMFYFPNAAASSDLERTPTPLRPLRDNSALSKITVEAPWIDDSERRRKAEVFLRFINQERQEHIAGKGVATFVRYMCVDPKYQRQGFGKALMSWGCERFDEVKSDAYLEASSEGQGLYEKFGFKVIEPHSYGEFEDGIKLNWSHMWRDAKK
ncbi:hypothetical protein TruAng_011670 [Truncatella angustata]|nr:hypothetical protein TruAng_011670 [Truncatella angustata]